MTPPWTGYDGGGRALGHGLAEGEERAIWLSEDSRSREDAAPDESHLLTHLEPPQALGTPSEPVRPWLPKTLVLLADVATIAVAMTVAFVLRPLVPGSEVRLFGTAQYAVLGTVSLPIWVGLMFHYRLYCARHVASAVEEFGRIIHAAGASAVVIAFTGFMLRLFVSRAWLGLSFVCAVAFLGIERAIVRHLFRVYRRRGRMLRSVVIVGGNVEGLAISRMLHADLTLGYRVVGLVDDHASRRTSLEAGPLVGRVEETLDAIERTGATGVIVATTGVEPAALNRLTRELSEAGVHMELSSSLRDIAAKRLTVRNLGRFQVVHVDPVQRRGWRASAKRAFDVAGACGALVVLSPALVVIALAIKVNPRSRGPVLFRQERLGRDGARFEMLKFRTMQVSAHDLLDDLREQNHAAGPLFKLRDDPRVTPVGRVLRKFSLDELPQLWNVVRGNMSLVGPRPALPDEVLGWTPELHQRLAVLPGMTGMWQISGRSNSTFEDYTRLDLYYVDNWSLWTDLTILAKTVPAVLLRRGAY